MFNSIKANSIRSNPSTSLPDSAGSSEPSSQPSSQPIVCDHSQAAKSTIRSRPVDHSPSAILGNANAAAHQRYRMASKGRQ